MKKLIASLLIAALCLTGLALAETYTNRDNDLTFEYDANLFEITMEDESDDELLVVLLGKNEAWGEAGINIYMADVDDGATLPSLDSLKEVPGASNAQIGEWNGFKDVRMYDVEDDNFKMSTFIVPVYDDDGELEDILSISVSAEKIEDEDAAMARDDAISAVLDSLKLIDD